MAFSVFDHPHFSALLRHDAIAELLGEKAELSAMLRFEAALAEVEADLGVIPKEAGAAIAQAIRRFQPPHDALVEGTRRDGLIVPSLVACLREAVPEAHRPHVHFGATSQDVIDTGLILRLQQALAMLRRDLETMLSVLSRLSSEQGEKTIMGRTRMQAGSADHRRRSSCDLVEPSNSPAGCADRLGKKPPACAVRGGCRHARQAGGRGAEVRAALAEHLGLIDPGRPWHAERGRIADLAGWLSKLSGSIGKIGQDLVLMAQNEVGEASFASGGTSSAMPHKKNPVQAEMLITLARYNASQIGAIHHSLGPRGRTLGRCMDP